MNQIELIDFNLKTIYTLDRRTYEKDGIKFYQSQMFGNR